ncbi:MAG TPA: HAD family hydrolase [Candidatus Paceibacterota bacterium]|nr:HAD family hydrolase [Candidatus Paceibacterota bacterium]HPT17946.1 HAD family hydrolase [Candidatus Paceibacterota bacterium]
MNIKWIFFDIGGVLADESEFQKIRENYNWETVKHFELNTTKEEIMAIWPEASGMIGDLDINIVSLALKDKSKIIEAVELMKTKRSEAPSYYDLLKVREEAKEVISKLSQKYKLGIIANQNSKVKEKLKEADLLKYFQNTDVSGDHKLNKPNSELFKKIFEITGASPVESVMIDDNIERGLSPAKNLNMTTVWYRLTDRNNIPTNTVDYTVVSLMELLKIF